MNTQTLSAISAPHLPSIFGRFPEIVLRDLGFEYGGKSWGNDNLPYYELFLGQSIEVYVVNFEEVWICVGQSYRRTQVGSVGVLELLIKTI